MEEALYIFMVAGGGMLFITLLNAFTAPLLAKAPVSQTTPLVSLLVPARNEELNIEACLQGLLRQDYPDFEIIVLNDQSSDRTGEIVQALARQHPRLRYLKGRQLPPGWVGKNWACQQLSEAARGDIFIFVDADTRQRPGAVRQTVAWMKSRNLEMLSAFLEQITVTWAEKLIIPVITLLVYSLLPLWLTYYLRSPALVAANGQWIAFTRKAYRQIGGHQSVREQVVEDMALGRLVKQRGLQMLAVSGIGVLSCRMYRSAREVWNGFTKNLFGIAGYHPGIFLGMIILLLGTGVLPYLVLFWPSLFSLAALTVAINLAIRGALAWRCRHPFWISIVLHPLSILGIVAIGLNSLRIYFSPATTQWKGRKIVVGKVNAL